MKKQDLKQLPLSQAAFPVSPSPPPENGRALRMNATCGRKCAALLPSCGPAGCLGKMLLASSIWGSTKRSLTWQKRDTLFSHSYFRLAVSAHGMSASELLSSRLMFPTPLASDNNTARDAASLDVFLSDNGIFRKRNRNGAIWSLSLSAAVFYLTPVASDGFRSTLKPSAFDPAKGLRSGEEGREPVGTDHLPGTAGVRNGGTEPGLGGMAHGLPERMDGRILWAAEPEGIPRMTERMDDRALRLKTLGNAVCPPQAYPIFRYIIMIENGTCGDFCPYGKEGDCL